MPLRDIDFHRFDWHVRPDGDLARVENRESFRDLVNRWLLTNPSTPVNGLVDEEIEGRRTYSSQAERAARYLAPEGDFLLACVPWDPGFGAGIKQFLNSPVTPQLRGELTTRIRAGLARLQGVLSVVSVNVSAANDTLTVHWVVTVQDGIVEDTTKLPRTLLP